MIPSIPFKILTIQKRNGELVRETRNATTLPQAHAVLERELRKPHTRVAELWVCLCASPRHGGLDDYDPTK